MKIVLGAVRLACVGLMMVIEAGAAEPVKVRLWPEGAPGAKGDADIDQPFVEVWQAAAEAPGRRW